MTYAYKLICARHTKSPEIFYGENWHSAIIFTREHRATSKAKARNFPACEKQIEKCFLRQNEFIAVAQSRSDFFSVCCTGKTRRLSVCIDADKTLAWSIFDTLKSEQFKLNFHNLCGLKCFVIVVYFQDFHSLWHFSLRECLCKWHRVLSRLENKQNFYFWLLRAPTERRQRKLLA